MNCVLLDDGSVMLKHKKGVTPSGNHKPLLIKQNRMGAHA